MATTTRADAQKSTFIAVRDNTTGNVRRVIIPSPLQVGADGLQSALSLFGGIELSVQTLVTDVTNKGTLSIDSPETVIAVDASGFTPASNRVRINLGTGSEDGEVRFIKDVSGTAGSIPIDIYPPSGQIDHDDNVSITVDDGTIVLVWFNNSWHILIAVATPTGSGTADSNASYVVLKATGSLNHERVLSVSGSALVATDTGGVLSLDLASIGPVGSYSNANITVDAYGRITAAADGTGGTGTGADPGVGYVTIGNTSSLAHERALTAGQNVTITDNGVNSTVVIAVTSGFADVSSSYITIGNTGSLPNERALAAGTGMTLTDAGAGSTVALGINDSVVATVSGTRFTGNVRAASGLSGSVQNLDNGTSYLVAGANITITSASSGQVTIASSAAGGGADVSASYITIGNTGSLPNERKLTAGGNMSFSDDGAGGNLTIDLTSVLGLPNAGTFINAQVTADQYGRITAISRGVLPAPTTASYVVLSNDPTLPSERVLTAGTGISVTDAGANTTVTLAIKDGVVATVSGTRFTGNVRAAAGLSGSLQKLDSGISYLVAGDNVTLTSQSNGQIIVDCNPVITASVSGFADVSASYVVLSATGSLENERVLTAGTGLTLTDAGAGSSVTLGINNNTVATVSGTTFTGGVKAGAGLTGSLWVLISGKSAFVAGTNITITSQSNGQLLIDGVQTSVSGSDVFASAAANYVTIGNTSSLSNERALVAGSGITITDNGANSTVVITANVITGSGADPGVSFVTMGNTASLANERALTAGFGISLTDNGANSTVVVAVNGTAVGADNAASYILIANTASLANERALAAGTGLSLTDAGAGSTVTLAIKNSVVATVSGTTFTGVVSASAGLSGSLQRIGPNLPYLITQNNALTITTQSNGQVLFNVLAADPGASYVTLGNTGSLANERVLTAGNGIDVSDNGANSSVILNIVDSVVATVSGARFTGNVRAATGLSGALQQLDTGISYLVAGPNIAIASSSNGQVTITATSTLADFDWIDGGNRIKTTSSLAVDTGGRYADQLGTDVYFFVSGSQGVQGGVNRHVGVFGGDVVVSGSVSTTSLTGSLQKLSNDTSYLVAGTNISISSASNGQVTVATTAAPPNASYITVGSETGLSAERALVAGTGISLTDNGANSTIVITCTVTGTGGGGSSSTPSAYYGFTTASNAFVVSGAWTPVTGAVTNITDQVTQSITRTNSIFTINNAGFYSFHASFNVYGSDAYVTLRLSGSRGIAMKRTTYRTNPMDQAPIVLNGVLSASTGDAYLLEYVTSGTILPWVPSNPMFDGTNMVTGEVSIFSIGG